MRLLLLASPFDGLAQSVAARVRASGGTVTAVSLEDLGAARWIHRLGAGEPETEIVLADGTVLDVSDHDVVFNRLRYEPTLLFTRMAAADRDYARAEFHALLLSWLQSMAAPMLGRPAPPALAGRQWSAWAWLAAAADAGFAPYPARATSSARLATPPAGDQPCPALLPDAFDPALDQLGFDRPRAHVPPLSEACRLTLVRKQVVEPVAPDLAACAARLAERAGADLLVVELARTGDDPRWRFVAAEPMPDALEEPAIDALLQLLGRLA